jgi:Ca2+-binding EF-hand superfamily protein
LLKFASNAKNISEICSKYDTDKRGIIGYKEFNNILTAAASGLSSSELQNLAKHIDKHHVGAIRYNTIFQDLAHLQSVKSTPPPLPAEISQQSNAITNKKKVVVNIQQYNNDQYINKNTVSSSNANKENNILIKESNHRKYNGSLFQILDSKDYEPVYRVRDELIQNNWVIQSRGGTSAAATKVLARVLWNKESEDSVLRLGQKTYSEEQHMKKNSPKKVNNNNNNNNISSSYPISQYQSKDFNKSNEINNNKNGSNKISDNTYKKNLKYYMNDNNNNQPSPPPLPITLEKNENSNNESPLKIEKNIAAQLGGRTRRLHHALSKYDKTKSGKISYNEFRNATKTAGIILPDKDIIQLFQKHVGNNIHPAATTGNHLMDVNTFVNEIYQVSTDETMSEYLQNKSNEEKGKPKSSSVPISFTNPKNDESTRVAKKVLNATNDSSRNPLRIFQELQSLNKDGGYLTIDTMKTGLHHLGVTLSEPELNVLVERVDPNKSGKVII